MKNINDRVLDILRNDPNQREVSSAILILNELFPVIEFVRKQALSGNAQAQELMDQHIEPKETA